MLFLTVLIVLTVLTVLTHPTDLTDRSDELTELTDFTDFTSFILYYTVLYCIVFRQDQGGRDQGCRGQGGRVRVVGLVPSPHPWVPLMSRWRTVLMRTATRTAVGSA